MRDVNEGEILYLESNGASFIYKQERDWTQKPC